MPRLDATLQAIPAICLYGNRGFVFRGGGNSKNMKKIIISLLLAAAVDAQAAPYFHTGNEFLALPRQARTEYVTGVADGILATESTTKMFCVPKEATNVQLTAVAEKYLNDHPEELHERAAVLIAMALNRAFNCYK